jgi:hypothetical protein
MLTLATVKLAIPREFGHRELNQDYKLSQDYPSDKAGILPKQQLPEFFM